MNPAEAREFIQSTNWKGSRLGLERMRELTRRLGDPQKDLKFIHVAGTNGKGSTCALLASILTAAGCRTGLYTSPRLLQVKEQIKVDSADISDADLASMSELVKEAADGMEDKPTEFEIITALAFCYFRRQACDIVVLEVGLGGRLDATNVVPAPEVAVITNIGLEHTEILGDSLEKIAAEKAGVIKEGCAAVTYGMPSEVEEVYAGICAQKGVPWRAVRFDGAVKRRADFSEQIFDWKDEKGLRIQLLGEHQIHNTVMALETIEVLRERGWTVSSGAVRRGLSETRWPARFEVLSRDPLFIADGAHNPQCVETLVQNIRSFLPGQKVTFLLGILADKDYEGMLDMLEPYGRSFVCVAPRNPRALRAETLASCLRRRGQKAAACETIEEGIGMALALADGSPAVACGSLYMMGEIRSKFPSVLDAWRKEKKTL